MQNSYINQASQAAAANPQLQNQIAEQMRLTMAKALQNNPGNGLQNPYSAILSNPVLLQKMLMAKMLNQAGQPVAPKNTIDKNHCESCELNLEEHLKYADALADAGLIDSKTRQLMKDNMTAKISPKAGATAQIGEEESLEEEFLKSRQCLAGYLKEIGFQPNKEEIGKIKEVIGELEKQAVAAHLSANNAKEDAFLKENEFAKERLMTGSLSSKKSANRAGKFFTREEISKMNSAEFSKNEPTINYQLENGLL